MLSSSLRIDNDISIINIGHFFSKTLKNQPHKTHIIKNRYLITSGIILKNLIEMLEYDFLHSFNPPSLTILESIMEKEKIKEVETSLEDLFLKTC